MLRAEHDDLMIALINSFEISERVREVHFKEGEDWHANDAETSLMLAVSPAMVVKEKITEVDDPDRTGDCVFSHPVNRTSVNGVTGTPSVASVEKGKELFSWMVKDLSALVEKGLKEAPPLPYSYFEKVN
jgi:creatinine amidohydrolase